MFHRVFSMAVLSALVGASAQAGVITGRLVDSQGQPVPNATFQLDLRGGGGGGGGGGSVIASGAFTDANGYFTTTVTPNGDYRLTAYPQPPPAKPVVVTLFDGITVGVTPNNVGSLVLPVGTTFSGRVVNGLGTPLVGVSLGYLTSSSSQSGEFTNPDTDSSGHFTVAVPYGPCTITYKPGPVPYYGGPGTAPTTSSQDFTGPVNAGDVVLPPGFTLSGSVVDSSGAPVEDAEVHVVDRATGQALYTPENRTGLTGAYSVLVPTGTFDVQILPRSNDGLVSATIPNKTVTGPMFLGTTTLADGRQLKGKARNQNGTGLAGVSLFVVDATTQQVVPLTDNVTTAGGNYKVFVPTGTFHVTFSPPIDQPLGSSTVANVVVSGNTTQDATLPDAPFFTNVGTGVAGTGGLVPQIVATGGAPRVGNLAYAFECSNALGGSPGMIETWVGTPPTFPGVSVLMQRSLVRLEGAAGVAGDGRVRVPFGIPNTSTLVGQEIRARFVIRDRASPHARSLTNELRATIAP